MKIIQKSTELRKEIQALKDQKRRIGFVPTMGALHQGHLSLVNVAKKESEVVVMSIFVNPLQFNSAEDLKHYPRTLELDVQLASKAGVDLLFAPDAADILPPERTAENDTYHSTRLLASSLSSRLCGEYRPGHFDGVVTIVSILFHVVEPDVAIFGEKDFQQLRVIEDMVEDLHLPVRVVGAPLIRDSDGLALSSRNERLNSESRFKALYISRSLLLAQQLVANGEGDVSRLLSITKANLEKAGDIEIEYLEICDADTLEPVTEFALNKTNNKTGRGTRMFVAVRIQGVRLIDNVRIL